MTLKTCKDCIHGAICTICDYDDVLNVNDYCGYFKDKAYLAVAVSYDEKTGLAEFTQRNKMVVGDNIELLTPGKTGVSLTVTKLYDENMNEITGTSHPYMKFFMEVPFEIKAGDIIRAS